MPAWQVEVSWCLVALILSIEQRCGDATDMANASQTSHPPAILKSAIVLANDSPSISIVALEDATVVRGVRVVKGWNSA